MCFINKLSEDRIIALINFCLNKRNESEENELPLIDRVNVLEYSVDKNPNNASLIVQTFLGDSVQGAYQIDDYNMVDFFYGMDRHPDIYDYSFYLKVFMARTFGANYMNELYAYRRYQLNKEMDEVGKALEESYGRKSN